MIEEYADVNFRVLRIAQENIASTEHYFFFPGALSSPIVEGNFAHLVEANDYDIVHFQHLGNWASFYLPLIAKAAGKKVVLSIHDYYLLCPEYNLLKPDLTRCGKTRADGQDEICINCLNEKRRFRQETKQVSLKDYIIDRFGLSRKIMQIADLIIFPSVFCRDIFVRAFGKTLEDKTVVLPHGVAVNSLSQRPPRSHLLHVGFLGNISDRKGAFIILEAVSKLRDKSSFSFEVIGEFTPELKNYASYLGIRIHGKYDHIELPQLLQDVDVAIIPSICDETFCMTVSECQAMGIPVIASSVGAIKERIIDGKTGFLVPPNDPNKLVEKLIEISSSPYSLESVLNGLKSLKIKSINENVSEYADVYKDLLGARKSVSDTDSNAFSQISFSHDVDSATQAKELLGFYKPEIAGSVPPLMSKDFQKGLTSIIILTFNQLRYTKECVDNIRKHTHDPHEIIFVDNGSKDGTVKWLRRLVQESPGYKLIENERNLGFAKGCNQGILVSSGEYILLLNNDVVVTEGWLSGMLECLNSAPDTGIVGPMTNFVVGIQKVENVGYKALDYLSDYARSFRLRYRYRRIPSERLVGFCMLFRRGLSEKIGLLDERFGSGNFEDDDYCLRASLEGYKNLIAGDVFIHHYGGRSFIGSGIDHKSQWLRNKVLFSEKWESVNQ